MSNKTAPTIVLPPKPLLTPKELAAAIGASESSVRRWVDSGDLHMSRTAGGHRRIPLPEAIQFIRRLGAPILRPDLLGLGFLNTEQTAGAGTSGDEQLFEALRTGDRELAKGMIVNWYVEGRSLPELFDGPLRGALHRIGTLWEHDLRGILSEHRATEICIEAIGTIRGLLPVPDEKAPLALGGAPEGDPYQIPSLMAAAVLTEIGFQTMNFGANTPVNLLALDAAVENAALVWLSVSAPVDFKATRAKVKKLAVTLALQHVKLILGGRYRAECTPTETNNLKVVDSMAELAAFSGKLTAHTESK